MRHQRGVERRQAPRVDAGLPVELDVGERTGELGIAHDVSRTGLLLFSRVELEPGAAITLRLRPQGPQGELEEITAKVIRSEQNDAESMWPVRSAVTFDEELDVALDVLEQS